MLGCVLVAFVMIVDIVARLAVAVAGVFVFVAAIERFRIRIPEKREKVPSKKALKAKQIHIYCPATLTVIVVCLAKLVVVQACAKLARQIGVDVDVSVDSEFDL